MSRKPCPMMIAHYGENAADCIGERCAWWCEFAGDCSVPLIAGILADSTICNSVFNQVRTQEKVKQADPKKRCNTCQHDNEEGRSRCFTCYWTLDPADGKTKIPSNWEQEKEIGI